MKIGKKDDTRQLRRERINRENVIRGIPQPQDANRTVRYRRADGSRHAINETRIRITVKQVINKRTPRPRNAKKKKEEEEEEHGSVPERHSRMLCGATERAGEERETCVRAPLTHIDTHLVKITT